MYPSSTAERLGVLAGTVVAALLVAVMFVGQWRAFTLGSAGTLPFDTVEGAGNGPFLVGIVGTFLVTFVAGSAYPYRIREDEELARDELVMGVFIVPLLLLLVGMVALFLVPAGESLLSGAVTDAVLQALVGLVLAILLSGLVATVVAVYVGLPALVGVYAGALVGRAAVPD